MSTGARRARPSERRDQGDEHRRRADGAGGRSPARPRIRHAGPVPLPHARGARQARGDGRSASRPRATSRSTATTRSRTYRAGAGVMALDKALGDRAGITPLRALLAGDGRDAGRLWRSTWAGAPTSCTTCPRSPGAGSARFDCDLVKEFFQALVVQARMNLHLHLRHGGNAHHVIEASFKALRAGAADGLRARPGAWAGRCPSTKGCHPKSSGWPAIDHGGRGSMPTSRRCGPARSEHRSATLGGR